MYRKIIFNIRKQRFRRNVNRFFDKITKVKNPTVPLDATILKKVVKLKSDPN